MSVFGCVARGNDQPDCELVDLDDCVALFKLMLMKSRAEAILGRTADVIPREGLKRQGAATV